jgi:hypothetical protein
LKEYSGSRDPLYSFNSLHGLDPRQAFRNLTWLYSN